LACWEPEKESESETVTGRESETVEETEEES
jgi:hypothetical protein